MKLVSYNVYHMILSVMFMYFLSFLDISATYFLLRRYRTLMDKWKNIFPVRFLRSVEDMERNPIGKKVFKALGLEKGYFVLLILGFLGFSVLAYLPLNIFMYVFVDGALFIVLWYHYQEWMLLNEEDQLLQEEYNRRQQYRR